MRIPLRWLGEFVELPDSITPEDVHHSLVSIGLEEEAIHRSEISGPIVVGEVLEFVAEEQSNGKTIRWCQVRVANEDAPDAPAIRGIVCGAGNFEPGDRVVVALPGSVLPGPFPITSRKTYGHISDGMIASARELGLGDEHDGILLLESLGIDEPVGADAISLLGLGDVACEVNVTPDRGYALSMRGIAREYHHATGAAFHDPALAITPGEGSGFPIVINDESPVRGVVGCEVFITRAVRGIDPTKPTPAWMVSRLSLAGMRSISLPVDITNYVMLELGQPLHAYDLDRLSGGITVRRARSGEKLTTLDGVERELYAEDLLITDESGPIGMAGVMGGLSTEITDASTTVLIEAAGFEPVTIQRTQRRHKLPSEASKRFSRGVDPLVAEAAAERAVELLEKYAGGTRDSLGSGVISATAGVMPELALAKNAVADLAGMDVSGDDTRAILLDIGATVVPTENGFLVTPPSWRPDLVDAPGLVEEVARIVGYDTIASVLPTAPPGRGLSAEQKARRRVSHSLAAWGATEVLSYPFVSAQANDTFSLEDVAGGITVANALDLATNRMRVSLIPGLLATAHRNYSRGFTSQALYETGLVFLPGSTDLGTSTIPVGNERPSAKTLEGLYASIGHQPWCVGALFLGDSTTRSPGLEARSSDVGDALDVVNLIGTALGVTFELASATHPAFHPGRYAQVLWGSSVVGRVGELLPSLARAHDLPERVSVCEIDVDAVLLQSDGAPHIAHPISVFPAATQDVSLVVSDSVSAAELAAALREGAGELMESLHLVDDYRGAGIDEGFKSLTFALRFRSSEGTLTQAEATEAKEAGVALAAARHGAKLRA